MKTRLTESLKNHKSLTTPQACVKGAMRDLGHEKASNGVIGHEVIALATKLFTKYFNWSFDTIAEDLRKEMLQKND